MERSARHPSDFTPIFFLCSSFTVLVHHLLSFDAGWALPPERQSLVALACSFPVPIALLFSSLTPQRLREHHPLFRCQAPCCLIGVDPKHVVGQPERAARHWEGSTPSPPPRQLLLEHADKTLQWLGAPQQPAVDEKGRVPVTPTRVPSSTSFCTRAW